MEKHKETYTKHPSTLVAGQTDVNEKGRRWRQGERKFYPSFVFFGCSSSSLAGRHPSWSWWSGGIVVNRGRLHVAVVRRGRVMVVQRGGCQVVASWSLSSRHGCPSSY
jgi:hypothetical protein